MAATKNTKKKSTVQKTKASKATKVADYKHFKLEKAKEPFFTLKVTRQTLYWTLFTLFIAGIAIWIINLQVSINSLYDKIDQEESLTSQIDNINHQVKENKKAIYQNKTRLDAAAKTNQ